MTNSHAAQREKATADDSLQFFDMGPSRRLSTSSLSNRIELEHFATTLRGVVRAGVAQVHAWPYRYAGTNWWSFEFDGIDGVLSLTFEESGRSRLPRDLLHDRCGAVVDSVDAFYLFAFLERELSVSPDGF